MIRKSRIYTYIIIALFTFQHIKAQVNIGSDKKPEAFSLLEINSPDRGLIHPQMSTIERNAFTTNLIINENKENEARGLIIFNTTTHCLEYYKNKAEGWVSLCNEINIEQIPLDDAVDPAFIRPYADTEPTLTDGTYGKRKYDVAQSDLNSSVNGSCGLKGAAHGRPGDFNTANDYKRYYVLEFAASEDMTKITDIVVGIRQFETKIVTISGDKSGGGETPNTFARKNNIVVDFFSSGANAINTIATGKKEANALYTTIYAIFKRNGELRRVEYTFLVMDCLGCGVRSQSGDKQWLPVACYNLGVEESPSTPSPLLYNTLLNGDVYQWGRIADGHEKANSPIFVPSPAIGEITYPTTPIDLLDSNGQPMDNPPFNFRVGSFIPVTSASQSIFYGDWSAAHNAKLWGDGTQNPQMTKSVNDPCPTGFRLPTAQEMTIIMNALTVDNSQNGAIPKAGDDETILFLPYTTVRGTNGIALETSNNIKAQYWTSTTTANTVLALVKAFKMESTGMTIVDTDRAWGNAVRCIAE